MTRPLVPSMDAPTPHTCEGCGTGLSPVEGARWRVCLDCTRARHRAVIARGRCRCGKKARPGEVCRMGSRSWVPCRRCLGSLEQLT